MQICQKAPEAVAVTQAPEHAAAQVFKHRQLGEDIGDLKAARQTHAVDLERLFPVDALAVQQHFTAGGLKSPADEVEQGAFTRAIGPDDGNTLASIHSQLRATDDFGLAKVLAQITQLQRIGLS